MVILLLLPIVIVGAFLFPRLAPFGKSAPAIVLKGVVVSAFFLIAWSLLAFYWLLVNGTMDELVYAEVGITFCGCLGAVFAIRQHSSEAAPILATSPAATGYVRVLPIVFFAILLLDGRWWERTAAEVPRGGWDAMAIWNHRARFLERVQDDWRRALTPVSQHPDYPLFVPLSVARLHAITGEERVFDRLTNLLLVALLVAGLEWLRGGGQGWLAGILLLSSPSLVMWSCMMYADVPLAFFYLATIVFLLAMESSESLLFPLLAGLFASAAAWTKNEGQLFLVVIFAVQGSWTLLRRQRPRKLAGLVIGTIPVGITLAIFKLALAPENDLVAGQNGYEKLFEIARWKTIFQFYSSIMEGGMILVLGGAVLLGLSPHEKWRGIFPGILVIALVALGYTLVFVLTPQDLQWHLGTAAERLMVQLWPSALFLLFVRVHTPAELWNLLTTRSMGTRRS